jgi:dCTP deaminase
MILPAQTVRALCTPLGGIKPMLSPFNERTLFEGRSFGLSSCGYDIRLAEDIWLWPLYGRLASSIEYFNMPKDVAAEVKDKSTNARLFTLVQNTFIEPGWSGYLTLELTRDRPWPVFLKRGTPIAQIIFYRLENQTEQPYTGKYQNQKAGPQTPIMEK